MKKFTALILTLVSALILLTSCSSPTLILDGKYYQSSLSGITAINETCVYDVTVVNKTPSNSTEFKNDIASLHIDEGTYTTNLITMPESDKQRFGEGYLYTTNLTIKGKYVINGTEHPIEDTVTSKTWFKNFHSYFEPYRTEKYVNSSTLTATNVYNVTKYEYEYVVDYNDKAIAEIKVIKDEAGHLSNLSGKAEYAKYNDGAFIENELLLFVPRSFNLDDSYLQSVKTLDVISRKIQPMQYTTSNTESGVSVKTIKLPSYTYNGVTTENKDVLSTMLTLQLTDVFKGAEIETYYATDYTEMRHSLVQFFTKINSDLGYLQYTLKEVNFTDK